MEQYAGIDYGRGLTNIDQETGIRYGVINQNEVLQAWADSSEAVYPDLPFTCPECGNELIKIAEGLARQLPDNQGVEITGDDYHCETCDKDYNQFDREIESENDFQEPIEFTYESEGYICHQSSDDTDIFVIKSPYFTYCQFCSPCAPGAGYLMNYFKPSAKYRKKTNPINGHEITCGEWYKIQAEDAGYIRAYCFGHDWYEEQETGNWIDCQYCNGTGYREKSSIPDYQKREKELIESGFVVPFDDNRFICNVCGKNHQYGQIGKVKEMISKAPYPVFSVETGELISCD